MSQKNLTYFSRVGYDISKSLFENVSQHLGIVDPIYLTGRAAAQLWLVNHHDCMIYMARDIRTYERLAEWLELEEFSSNRDGTHLRFHIVNRLGGYMTARIYKPNATVGTHPLVRELRGKVLPVPLSSADEVLSYFSESGGLGSAWFGDLAYYLRHNRIPRNRQFQRLRYTL